MNRTEFTPDNIDEQVERLKYSSNKMTQILLDELNSDGLPNYEPSIDLNVSNPKTGLSWRLNPKDTKDRVNQVRLTLNSKIITLDKLAKEAKTNPIFQGENGMKNWRKACIEIEMMGYNSLNITSAIESLKKNFNIDLTEQLNDVLKNNSEINFKLKPETIQQIEKDDFSSSYDNSIIIENVKKALNVPVTTKIMNWFLKVKNKIFPSKKEEVKLLTDGQINDAIYEKKSYSEMIKGIEDLEMRSEDLIYGNEKKGVKSAFELTGKQKEVTLKKLQELQQKEFDETYKYDEYDTEFNQKDENDENETR